MNRRLKSFDFGIVWVIAIATYTSYTHCKILEKECKVYKLERDKDKLKQTHTDIG